MSHPERRGTLHKHNHTATVFAFFTVNDSKVSRDVGCQPSAPALSSLPTPPPPSFPFFQPPAPAPRLPGVSPPPPPLSLSLSGSPIPLPSVRSQRQVGKASCLRGPATGLVTTVLLSVLPGRQTTESVLGRDCSSHAVKQYDLNCISKVFLTQYLDLDLD